ncbi:unnamed protein product [Lota lota]
MWALSGSRPHGSLEPHKPEWGPSSRNQECRPAACCQTPVALLLENRTGDHGKNGRGAEKVKVALQRFRSGDGIALMTSPAPARMWGLGCTTKLRDKLKRWVNMSLEKLTQNFIDNTGCGFVPCAAAQMLASFVRHPLADQWRVHI